MKLLLILVCSSVLGQAFAVTRQEIYDLIQSDRYDANEPPPPDGEPTDIKLGIYVNSLGIDRVDQKVVWSMYLRQEWNDSRITSLFSKDDEPVMMGKGHWKSVWYPDLFFRNSLEVTREDNPAEQTLLRIQNKGLWLVHKLKLTTTCYGFHRIGKNAVCPLMIESFKYTMDQVKFSWLASPLDVDPGIRLKNFVLKQKMLFDCSQNYTSGAYPCREMRLFFHDDSTSSVMAAPRLAFAIGIFLVIVSWLSFWIDGDKIAERLGILFGSAMTLMLLGIGIHVNSDLDTPNNYNYIFIGAFELFVVAAMLEYVIVYGAMQWIPAAVKSVRKGEVQSSSSNRLPRLIDTACGLVVFPVVFLLFVCFYAVFILNYF